MSSYRRHVARHPLALPRALRAVRRHALETGPQDPNHWSVHTTDPFDLMCGGPPPVIGTRWNKVLRCLEHPIRFETDDRLTEITVEDLPDGGICTYVNCGRDLLA